MEFGLTKTNQPFVSKITIHISRQEVAVCFLIAKISLLCQNVAWGNLPKTELGN